MKTELFSTVSLFFVATNGTAKTMKVTKIPNVITRNFPMPFPKPRPN